MMKKMLTTIFILCSLINSIRGYPTHRCYQDMSPKTYEQQFDQNESSDIEHMIFQACHELEIDFKRELGQEIEFEHNFIGQWFMINQSHCRIKGTPTVNDIGNYTINVVYKNQSGFRVSRNMKVEILGTLSDSSLKNCSNESTKDVSPALECQRIASLKIPQNKTNEVSHIKSVEISLNQNAKVKDNTAEEKTNNDNNWTLRNITNPVLRNLQTGSNQAPHFSSGVPSIPPATINQLYTTSIHRSWFEDPEGDIFIVTGVDITPKDYSTSFNPTTGVFSIFPIDNSLTGTYTLLVTVTDYDGFPGTGVANHNTTLAIPFTILPNAAPYLLKPLKELGYMTKDFELSHCIPKIYFRDPEGDEIIYNAYLKEGSSSQLQWLAIEETDECIQLSGIPTI